MLIAQISDTHVTEPGAPLEKRFATAARLEQAVAHLLSLSQPPDAVLVTGDCVNSGSPAEYLRFRELLAPLPMPVYVIPGNHEHRENLRAAFGNQGVQHHQDFIQYVVSLGALRLIALDTHVPGEDGGRLCEKRLRWLAERLAEDSDTRVFIFQHHPPFSIGVPLLDRTGLDGIEADARIIGGWSSSMCCPMASGVPATSAFCIPIASV